MRIIFMGSPTEVIEPCRSTLEFCKSTEHQLIAVISQPAKPAGRKKKLTDPPLATWAKENGIPTYQPEKSRSPEFIQELKELQPDLIITAAYGQILSQEFLDIPTRGTMNIHPSLLPQYRGASPVQTALYDGLTETGVSILFTVKALDAGNIICQKKSAIKPMETADELMTRLFKLGGDSIPEAVGLLEDPSFNGIPQDEDLVTHCHKFEKGSGQLDWNLPVEQIIHRYQAFHPWPGTFTFLDGKRVVFEKLEPYLDTPPDLDQREFSYIKSKKSLVLRCSDGYLKLHRLKPEGSKSLDGPSFWNGLKIKERGRFDEQ